MSNDQPIYVLDTNVLVDYVDIIPGENGGHPTEPTIDLENAHIVIPTVVIRELSNFKNEKTDRGKAARTVLRRLRRLVEREVSPMGDVYNLDSPVLIPGSEQKISILPVHKNFCDCLPYCPSDDDMDGQIILTTLAAGLTRCGISIDGTANDSKIKNILFDNVVLVTNDNGLAIRARERGLRTERYGYQYPEPYTGRRDVIVPKELFHEFYNSCSIDLNYWEEMMPDQPKLIANEFVVMKLANEADYPRDFDPCCNPYFCHIGRYDKNCGEITKLRYIRDFPVGLHNAGQAIYAEVLVDPEVAAVICTGPAGSGKTYMATVYGYQACVNGEFIGVTVVPCDSKSNLGALPGDLDEKMDPEVQPLKNALKNYLLNEEPKFRRELDNLKKYGAGSEGRRKAKSQGNGEDAPEKGSIKNKLSNQVDLIWDNWFSNIPIEYARGRDFSYELAIYDEFQDQTVSQADTLIKRLGCDGKIILTGDLEQIHAPYIDSSSSGLAYASRQLMDSPMVAQVCFIEDEVIRHPLVKMVTKRQKSIKLKK